MLLEREDASLQTRVTRLVAARDPGHVRLVNASAVTLGVLASVMLGSVIVHAFHASPGMLSLSLFLSVQAGNLAKGQSAKDRLLTTALMIPAAAAAILLAVAADQIRPLAIAGFVAVTGLAVWVRRYGQRASALGGIGFMSYFFTLFMRPEGERILTFLLVVACAIVPQLVVRWILLLRRPRREIQVLLHELRAASLAVVLAAAEARTLAQIRMPLARADEVGRAVTGWQDHYETGRYIDCGAADFAARVLDARVDTEEAAGELTNARARGQLSGDTVEAIAKLRAVLARGATQPEIHAAVVWAHGVVDAGSGVGAGSGHDADADADAAADVRTAAATDPTTAVYLLARAVITHARLHSVDLGRGLPSAAAEAAHGAASREPQLASQLGPSSPVPNAAQGPAASDASSSAASPAASAAPEPAPERQATTRRGWLPWREWSASSRMTVQAMIAASLASAVGEAISASRWYWAVMTAFVIFIGASTRGGILTRAMRRIWGTLGGILLGALVVTVSGDSTWLLVLFAVCAVFGMLYFGPVNYVYSALCITTMLVAIYHLLGVLNVQLLELRLVETLTGAAIGVMSAYLILSSSSRPALDSQVKRYLDALGRVLRASLTELSGPARDGGLVSELHALEACEAQVDQTVSGMAAAFVLRSGRRESETVHLMYVVTRAAARLTQSVEFIAANPRDTAAAESARRAIDRAVEQVEQSAARTRSALLGETPTPAAPDAAVVLTNLRVDGLHQDSAGAAAVQALARMNWALQRAERDTIAEREDRARA